MPLVTPCLLPLQEDFASILFNKVGNGDERRGVYEQEKLPEDSGRLDKM